MLLPAHEYLKPATLAEGLAALRERPGETRVLGGGTDVIFNMRGRLMRPDALLAIRELPELAGIEAGADGSLRLGAGCRLTDLVAAPEVTARWPALAAAFRAVASRHVRNMATLGGNLCLDTRCWYTNQTAEWRTAKGPCLKTGVDACHAIAGAKVCVALNNSDVAPALIALDARVTLASADGERRLPLAEFYRNDGIAHTVRRPDEILTAVHVPPATGRLVFIKQTPRQGMDFSHGAVAAYAEGDGRRAAVLRIVLGSLTSAPVSLDAPVGIILAEGLGDDAIGRAAAATRDELGALTNLYTPAAYKSRLARELVRDALYRLREA